MPRQLAISALKLETDAMQARERGLAPLEVVDCLNRLLKARKHTEQITLAQYNRWLKKLDKESIGPAHRSKVVERNVALGVNITGRLEAALERLDTWLPIAESEGDQVMCPECEHEFDGGPRDWRARLGVLKEMREHVKLYSELLERVYDMQNVAEFQGTVLAAIEEADPATAQRVREGLAKKHEVRRAALLGVAA
jgi:hypothetical protein